jgi:hypothetical protein
MGRILRGRSLSVRLVLGTGSSYKRGRVRSVLTFAFLEPKGTGGAWCGGSVTVGRGFYVMGSSTERLVRLRVTPNRARHVKTPGFLSLGRATDVLYPVDGPLLISRFD